MGIIQELAEILLIPYRSCLKIRDHFLGSHEVSVSCWQSRKSRRIIPTDTWAFACSFAAFLTLGLQQIAQRQINSYSIGFHE